MCSAAVSAFVSNACLFAELLSGAVFFGEATSELERRNPVPGRVLNQFDLGLRLLVTSYKSTVSFLPFSPG